MPNAKDVKDNAAHRIFVLGNTGAGKTTQFLTLPGKKFAYLFDPNALLSLRGHDVDYEEFLPTMVSLDVKSLAKDRAAYNDKAMSNRGSDQYLEWEKDFDAKMKAGFFDPYQWIALDSATTFLDLIMDRLLTINGKPGTFPGQDDWGPQMVAFMNVARALNGMGKGIYMTGHLKTSTDEITSKIVQLPLLTGQLREKIPLLFSDVFKMDALSTQASGNTVVKYQLYTTPNNRETPIRTSMRGLKPVEDVTIDWSKPPEGQGLGGILMRNRAGMR